MTDQHNPPLRIAFFVHDFPMVSETFVVNWAVGLAERGHHVDVFAMDKAGSATLPFAPIASRSRGRVRVLRPPGPVGALRHLLPLFRLRPRKVASLLMDGDRPLRERVQVLARASIAASSARYDVVHCQFAPLGLAAMELEDLGALRMGALAVHVRGYDVTKYPREHGEAVYRALFRRADRVIANCEHFRRRAIELGADAARTVVIGSPIDMAQFSPKQYGTRALHAPLRIALVGRLVEKKGFADAIDGLAVLRDRGLDARMTILGNGPLRSALEDRTSSLGLSEHVVFTGARPAGEVAALLHATDVLIAPSVTAETGDQDAPVNTLKEAMAVGLPVIGTRHGGIPELVEDGVNGYLVPERDPAAIADALFRLAEEAERWQAMGEAGRRKVRERYGSEAVIAKTVAEYRRMAGRSRSAVSVEARGRTAYESA